VSVALAAFAQFSSDLDEETKSRIDRGQRLTELLKQKQYHPLSIAEQVVSVLAANEGAFDVVPVAKIKDAQAELISAVDKDHKKLVDELNKGDKPSDEAKEQILKLAKKVADGYATTSKEKA
jgi:F-type H+-transporting ATPase subunit alpha